MQQMVGDPAQGDARGNCQYPRNNDTPGDPPADGRQPLGRAHTEDGRGDNVRFVLEHRSSNAIWESRMLFTNAH